MIPPNDPNDALLRCALEESAAGLAVYGASAGEDGGPVAFAVRYINPAAARLGGADRAAGPTPEDRAVFSQVLATGTADRREVEREVVDLGRRWVLETVRPLHGGVVAEFEDVTEAHRRAEAADLLARELSHRIKNVLAVVTSLITLTAKSTEDKDSFVERFRGRLWALARAHDVNSPLRSGGACSIGDLFRAVLAPYRGPDEASAAIARIEVNACDQWVGPTAATGLALLIHELATNALKYGALSNGTGSVSLRCTLSDTHAAISWCERGGPPILEEPVSSGFGLRMSQRVLTRQLDGSITYTWAREGLTAEILIPRTHLSA